MGIRRGSPTHRAYRGSELARDLASDVVTAQRPRAVRQQAASYRARRAAYPARISDPPCFSWERACSRSGGRRGYDAAAEGGSPASWLLQSAQSCVSGANLRPTMLFLGASLLANGWATWLRHSGRGRFASKLAPTERAKMRIRRESATHHAFRRSELARERVGN
jgi:hypothetical protein